MRGDEAWITEPANHLPLVKLNSHHVSLIVHGFHSSVGALIEKGHCGRNHDSDKGLLVSYCRGCRDEERPLPDLHQTLWVVVRLVRWGSGAVSLAWPQCAMLMMTDVLQLDVLTGPKALRH